MRDPLSNRPQILDVSLAAMLQHSGTTICEMNVQPADTWDEIMDTIAPLTGIPKPEMRLLIHGQRLADLDTVGRYKLNNGSEIEVFEEQRGGVERCLYARLTSTGIKCLPHVVPAHSYLHTPTRLTCHCCSADLAHAAVHLQSPARIG